MWLQRDKIGKHKQATHIYQEYVKKLKMLMADADKAMHALERWPKVRKLTKVSF